MRTTESPSFIVSLVLFEEGFNTFTKMSDRGDRDGYLRPDRFLTVIKTYKCYRFDYASDQACHLKTHLETITGKNRTDANNVAFQPSIPAI